MKRFLSFATLALIAVPLGLFLTGCNDETKADPAIVDSMNKQRAAQSAGAPGAAAPGTPGAPGSLTPGAPGSK
jgi:hypothetical protein